MESIPMVKEGACYPVAGSQVKPWREIVTGIGRGRKEQAPEVGGLCGNGVINAAVIRAE
jgi:hypothetical protein